MDCCTACQSLASKRIHPAVCLEHTVVAAQIIQAAWLAKHPRCCPICMDAFDKSKGLVDTPCGHKFCLPCYVRVDKPSCPMCRADTPLAEPKLPAGAVLFNRHKAVRSANRRAEERAFHRGQMQAQDLHIQALQQAVQNLEAAAAGTSLGKTNSAPICCWIYLIEKTIKNT